MSKSSIIRVIAFSMTITLLFSCSSPLKYARGWQADPALVKDFNPAKHVLLFASMPRLNNPGEVNERVTRKLEEALKKYCPYKYEIVPEKEIWYKTKYSDTSVYKYGIISTLNTTTHSTTTTTTITSGAGTTRSTVSPSARSTEIDFYFVDRTTNMRTGKSGAGTTHIDYTIAALMEIIKQTLAKR